MVDEGVNVLLGEHTRENPTNPFRERDFPEQKTEEEAVKRHDKALIEQLVSKNRVLTIPSTIYQTTSMC